MKLIVFATLIALVGYLGYTVVEEPGSQLFGKTVTSGPSDAREIALTFDDGPNPPYTDRILDVLRDEHVHATFFIVGRAAEAYPKTVRRIASEGHSIGNHTWDHPHLLIQSRQDVDAELRRTDDTIFRITGMRTWLMRPPFGARDFAVLDEAKRLGYTAVMWSVPLPNDWEQPGDTTIARRVIDNVHDGAIIVLHDGNRGIVCDPRHDAQECDRAQDVAATREIIDRLKGQGYRFVTVPQLLADSVDVTRTVSRSTR